jgi:N-acetylmuramoyl-L-alanine amidase
MLDKVNFKAILSAPAGMLVDILAVLRYRIWFHFYSRYTYTWAVPAVSMVIICLGVAIYYAIPEVEKRKQIKCLALNVYHEARGERKAGQYAVAEVTMNRVASKHYPNTVCEVVYQGGWDRVHKRYAGAFSWTELDTVTGVKPEHKMWVKAKQVAVNVYAGDYKLRVKGALFYHARYIKKPYWAKRKIAVARIGRHIFY